MSKTKIMIVGRSGSGKDTLATYLSSRYHLNVLVSTTTRPKRSADEKSHVFVTEEEANTMTDRVAETVINGYQYFATRKQLDENDIYVIDPQGLKCVCKNAPDCDLLVVYIKTAKDTRKERAVSRADDKEEAERVFEKRNADEDAMFAEFEQLCEGVLQNAKDVYPSAKSVIVFENDKNNIDSVHEIAEHIKNEFYDIGVERKDLA